MLLNFLFSKLYSNKNFEKEIDFTDFLHFSKIEFTQNVAGKKVLKFQTLKVNFKTLLERSHNFQLFVNTFICSNNASILISKPIKTFSINKKRCDYKIVS